MYRKDHLLIIPISVWWQSAVSDSKLIPLSHVKAVQVWLLVRADFCWMYDDDVAVVSTSIYDQRRMV